MKNEETLVEFIKEVTKNFDDEMSIKFTSGGIKLGAKWKAGRIYREENAKTELYSAINKIINGGKDLVKGISVSRGQAIDYAFNIALKVAKWQAERMYSEEEIRKAFGASDEGWVNFDAWYKNFKKE